jgi:hypothetical protein
MSSQALVHVTVLDASVDTSAHTRTGTCRLRVRSARALPRAVHRGTVRISGIERTTRGTFECRLLRQYEIERIGDEPDGALYSMSIDLSDEEHAPVARYAPPGACLKSPNESIEVVCKRIAGVFGRLCEEFRPTSVVVDLDGAS